MVNRRATYNISIYNRQCLEKEKRHNICISLQNTRFHGDAHCIQKSGKKKSVKGTNIIKKTHSQRMITP